MYDLKPIIAKNISALRIKSGMTQSELAARLNYSDKAVSKWERAESIPDVCVLTEIADLFGVPLDSLVREPSVTVNEKPTKVAVNKAMITLMAIIAVWIIATLVFAVADMVIGTNNLFWYSFVWAVPASAVVWLIFNSIWFNKKLNYVIISIILWTILAASFFTGLSFTKSFWQIFIVGVPAQALILAWSKISVVKKIKRKRKK